MILLILQSVMRYRHRGTKPGSGKLAHRIRHFQPHSYRPSMAANRAVALRVDRPPEDTGGAILTTMQDATLDATPVPVPSKKQVLKSIETMLIRPGKKRKV